MVIVKISSNKPI